MVTKLKLIIVSLFVMFSLSSCGGGDTSTIIGSTIGGGGAGGGGVVISPNGSIAITASPSSIPTFGLTVVQVVIADELGDVPLSTQIDFSLNSTSFGFINTQDAGADDFAMSDAGTGIGKVYFTANNVPGTVVITATVDLNGTPISADLSLIISSAATSAIIMGVVDSSVQVNNKTTVTAHVVDATGNPVGLDTIVYFEIDNESLGSLSSANAFTDANGDAQIDFTANSQYSGTVIVKAYTGGALGEVLITVTGGTASADLTVTTLDATVYYGVAATPISTTVRAVLKDTFGQFAEGRDITFSLDTNCCGTLSATTATTDATGVADVTFDAGTVSNTVNVTATYLTTNVVASLEVADFATVGAGSMTISAAAGTGGTVLYTNSSTTISVNLLDSSIPANPIGGQAINFTIDDPLAASLSPASTTTDTWGNASVTLNTNAVPTNVVITAEAPDLPSPSGLVTLRRSQTVTIEAPAPASITLGINPAEITIRGTATITATVKDAGGFPVIDGTPVTFVVLNTSIGDLSTTYATTANGNGTATTTFTAGIASGTTSIQASAGGVSISRPITVIPADTASIQFVSADPQIINLAQTGLNNTSLVIFTVSDITGWPVVDGTPVEFTLIGPNGGEYLGVNDETPTQHLASTTGGNVSVQLFSGGVSGPVTVKATTYKSSGAESTLSADLSADDTTITLVDASGFPATGRIRIDDEIISYTNNDGTNLTGVIRGDLGTLNVTHDGTTVPAIVYGQSTISTTAPEISIGGGSVSSTHFMSQVVYTDATRMPGKLWIDEYLGTDLYGYGGDPQEFETFFADRFGNYNVIEGTSAAYSMEASGIYSGGSSNPDGGHVTGVLITPSSSPKDVTPNSEELAWIHWVNTTFSDTGAEGILMNSIAAVTTVPETIYLNVSNSDHVVDFIDGSGLHQLRMGSEMMDYTFITGGSSSTFLSADIDLSDTAAFVYDNSSFPSSGTFAVDTNFYTYTSKTISVNAKLSALVLDIVDTTIPYSSPDGTFVVPGIFMIGSEVIECTGDTGTALTGCTRGIDGTNAAFHVSGDNITLAPSFILTAAATTTDLRNSLVAVPVELRIDKRGAPPGTTATATPVASHSALSVVRLFNSINIDVYEYAFREGSHHPRDGWVTIVTRVQGEETFIDENANGVFNRSYNTSSCPLTYSCECDGGVTDAHSSVIGPNDGVRVCAYLRSEAFKDLGEPFIDANEDGFRNDGTVAGSPVESYFDDLTLDNDGDGVTDTKDNQYTGPNGAWDGLDCKGFPCMNSKAVWTKSLVAFVGKPEYCLVTPSTFNISDGRSQEFIFYFADFNNNQLTADTEITFLTPFGVLSALPLYVPDDGVEIGGTVITATLGDPQPGDTNPRVSTSISFVATDSKTTKCYGSTEGFVD